MLTERRRRFIDYYIATGNGAESARLAGFAEPAKQSAYQVLTDMDVTEAIAERAADVATASELSPEWVVSLLMRTATEAYEQGNHPVVVAASRELGRVLGMFTDRTEVDVNIRIQELAKQHGVDPDQLQERVKQLREGS